MEQDQRCCGSGACIINDEGLCWCGQQWNGITMCRPAAPEAAKVVTEPSTTDDARGEAP